MSGPLLLPYPFPAGVGLPDSPGLKNIIPSYLYDEFGDDDDLAAFVDAYNKLAQRFLDWFNATPLPIYTDDAIFGLLLDWVGAGVYGLLRPSILLSLPHVVGSYGTGRAYGMGPPYGTQRPESALASEIVTDDIFKRILTWHYFKGDGKYFTITWLKKRVMRFLVGVNGTAPNIDQTYQISVTFGPDRQANIVIYNSFRPAFVGPGVYGRGRAYGAGPPYGVAPFTRPSLTPFAWAKVFKQALDSGVLELPFQWSWTCTIVG